MAARPYKVVAPLLAKSENQTDFAQASQEWQHLDAQEGFDAHQLATGPSPCCLCGRAIKRGILLQNSK